MDDLERKGLLEPYQGVIDQQLDNGITEQIKVKPVRCNKKVWIPHKPFIKM